MDRIQFTKHDQFKPRPWLQTLHSWHGIYQRTTMRERLSSSACWSSLMFGYSQDHRNSDYRKLKLVMLVSFLNASCSKESGSAKWSSSAPRRSRPYINKITWVTRRLYKSCDSLRMASLTFLLLTWHFFLVYSSTEPFIEPASNNCLEVQCRYTHFVLLGVCRPACAL